MSATDEQFAALVEGLTVAVREHTLRPKDRYYDPAPERAAVIAAHSDLVGENGRLAARVRALEAEYQRAIEELKFARQVLFETQEELRRLTDAEAEREGK